MVYKDRDLDTICAVSTPAGVGGISVVRVSGPQAASVTLQLCSFVSEAPESHRAYYGTLKSKDQKREIDEVVVTFFKRGRSFTGEDTFEISCHGSPSITAEILSELILAGGRTADRGEFTYRAFMNGRIDLVQAESVLSLIESQSKQSAQQALRQLQGSVSQELEKIENDMIWCLAHMEASIDFSTEGLEVVENTTLISRIETIRARLEKLVASYRTGQLLKDGFKLVLTGAPNVGKSSLLNLLLEKDRAIVTAVAGTTRDLIEDSFFVEGLKINIVDTAGLRDSLDPVEKIGIEKSYEAHKEADGIFFIFDSSRPLSDSELGELAKLPTEKTILIGNKRDVGGDLVEKRTENTLKTIENSPFFQKLQGQSHLFKEKLLIVSALDKRDGDLLRAGIRKRIGDVQFEDQAVISQARHFENLSQALQNMVRAKELVNSSASPEFMSLEMKEALLKVQETIGKRFDDQIMDRIFKEFCIGK